ncbi:MAG TPA: hypothetical protein VH276_17040 [Solirubrobacteraceae bacterium]|jgi:hypothetical protein|nr:hypothetical protein [Solirubrobacteraceae bacterium]
MRFVRYGLPLILLLVGIAFLIIEPNSTGLEGFCAGAGAALALLLLNVLFRAGVSGDRDRDREEEARVYYDEHGHWPDEAPRTPPTSQPDPPPEPREPRLPRGADGGAPVAPEHAPGEHRRQSPRISRTPPPRRR